MHKLRMGNISLNYDLFRLNMHENGMCPNCPQIFETVTHFLCECPKYIIERSMLLAEIDTTDGRIFCCWEELLTQSIWVLLFSISRGQKDLLKHIILLDKYIF